MSDDGFVFGWVLVVVSLGLAWSWWASLVASCALVGLSVALAP